MTIRNRNEAERADQQAGNNFFDPEAIRFFGIRIGSFYPTPDGAYFVTSEPSPIGNDPRLYTVRYINDGGYTKTIGKFQGYATAQQAKRAAQRYAAQRYTATGE